MFLLTYHNLDADHSYYLFDDHNKAVQYALDEIKHYDDTDGTVERDEDNNITFVVSDMNEAVYSIREMTEINPAFSPK